MELICTRNRGELQGAVCILALAAIRRNCRPVNEVNPEPYRVFFDQSGRSATDRHSESQGRMRQDIACDQPCELLFALRTSPYLA